MADWFRLVPIRLASCTWKDKCLSLNQYKPEFWVIYWRHIQWTNSMPSSRCSVSRFHCFVCMCLCYVASIVGVGGGGLFFHIHFPSFKENKRIRMVLANFIIQRPIEIGRTMCLLTDKLLYHCNTMCYFYRWPQYIISDQ